MLLRYRFGGNVTAVSLQQYRYSCIVTAVSYRRKFSVRRQKSRHDSSSANETSTKTRKTRRNIGQDYRDQRLNQASWFSLTMKRLLPVQDSQDPTTAKTYARLPPPPLRTARLSVPPPPPPPPPQCPSRRTGTSRGPAWPCARCSGSLTRPWS